ncbi:MAG: hypothetical protein IJ747_00970 [Lachnospiraceae bacterium]|nr:hypothetical protein [Lachnospiraceae bacterium]
MKSYVVMYMMGTYLLIGMVVLSLLFRKDWIAAMKQPVDLYAEQTDCKALVETDAVEGTFSVSLGKYAGHSDTGLYLYDYVIPAYAGEEIYWIGLEISSSDHDIMETITQDTYAYLNGELAYPSEQTLNRIGIIKNLSETEYQYLQDAVWGSGWYASEEDMRAHVLPILLNTVDNPLELRETLYMLTGIVVLFSLGCFGVGIYAHRQERAFMRGEIEPTFRVAANGQYAENSFKDRMITLPVGAYPRRLLKLVNQYVRQGQTEPARRMLWSLTALSYEDTAEVIAHWKTYYH